MMGIPELPVTDVTFWIIVAVVCGIVEAISLGITSIWFVVGAIVALILASFEVPFIIQVVVFLTVSIVLLIYTRPIATKYLKLGKEKTNVEAVVGLEGVVIEKIDNVLGKGQVKIGGQIWSAKSESGEDISRDEEVEVVAVKGVRVIVKKKEKEE
jgi:membrane protein implicated in regulation of membrane protease activity